MKFSINELSQMTGSTRATVTRKVANLPFEDGTKGAKLYESRPALEAILIGPVSEEGQPVSYNEAQRLLSIAKRHEIELGMEVTRKERIPLDVLETVNEKALSNVVGILKAHEGQLLTVEVIGDMLAEMREIGAKLKDG